MKATGMVRRVDDLGRVVIPKGLRRTLGIMEGDALEMFVSDEDVVLRRYTPACMICGNDNEVGEIHGKRVCCDCAKRLSVVFKLNVIDKSNDSRVG